MKHTWWLRVSLLVGIAGYTPAYGSSEYAGRRELIMTANSAVVADHVWQRADMVEALRARDVGAIFRLVRRHTGLTQANIGALLADPDGRLGGLDQSEVSRFERGRRTARDHLMLQRVATGLQMPPHSIALFLGTPPHCQSVTPVPSTVATAEGMFGMWRRPDVHKALSARDTGQLLRLARQHAKLTRAQLAALVRDSRGNPGGLTSRDISDYENGRRRVSSLELFERIADGLQMPDWARAKMRLAAACIPLEDASSGIYLHPQESVEEPLALAENEMTEEADTRRRDLLRLGRDISLVHVIESIMEESNELCSALRSGNVSDDYLTQFEVEARDIGVQAVRVPHLMLLERALAHGRIVRRLMRQPRPSSHRRRLERLSAQFALVVGEVLFMEGAFSHADTWYSAALVAAKDSGDEEMIDIVLASRAYLPSYSDDPRGVLALVAPRLERRSRSGPGAAWLWAFRSKAEASLGLAAEHERSVDRAREALDSAAAEDVAPGVFSFTPARLAFYETSGHVQLGRLSRATSAASTALELYDRADTSERALVRLEYAMGLVDAQETEEACRVASDAINDPSTSPCSTVRKRSLEFDRLLGDDSRPGAYQWRQALHDFGLASCAQ